MMMMMTMMMNVLMRGSVTIEQPLTTSMMISLVMCCSCDVSAAAAGMPTHYFHDWKQLHRMT